MGRLNARASASADEARKLLLERDLARGPRDRVLRALRLSESAKKSP